MSEKPFVFESLNNTSETNALIGRLFDATQSEAVFSDPVRQGEYTVMTAREVTVGMGAGYGGGGGTDGKMSAEAQEGEQPQMGYGGGGGGGGASLARPVAAITIGPDGVHVEPIVDPTKISIAFFTAFASILLMIGKMRRFGRTGKLD